MNHSVKGCLLGLLLVSGCVQTDVLFNEPVTCSFQYYQYMDDVSHETKKNSKPLTWSFTGLNTASPMYSTAGESGSVTVYPHEFAGGISLFIPLESGAHLFSIWPSGLAYWSKHKELGLMAAEQFRGKCEN